MWYFFSWYLILSLFGLAALPLGWTWFRHLPDRGWGLLRPLGLLLVGIAVWFTGSFGLLHLNAGSGLGGLLALGGLGLFALQRWGGGWTALRDWLRAHRGLLLAEEALFLLVFAFWTWYRVHESSGISHTEQPMDFAFLNAILRGGEIPPNDPWLSGFAISYYYLGYLIMAQVTALAGVISGVAYNLALMSLAAMASQGAFSLVYNMVAGGERDDDAAPHVSRHALAVALLGPLMLVGISNLTGTAVMAYNSGAGPDELFTWLAVQDLTIDPATGQRQPESFWWWWPASRTVLDTNADGSTSVNIDEFPFFSFLLGDMHPHVLSMPFVLLGLTLVLNALRGALSTRSIERWMGTNLPPESWGAGEQFGRLSLLLTVLILGSMAMLNTWDLPTLGTMLAAAWLVAALIARPREERRTLFSGWLNAAGLLIAAAFLLYLPFYIGFRSQAEGIRLSPFSTRPQQYFLMFGLFWTILIPLLLTQLGRVRDALRSVSQRALLLSAGMLAVDAGLLIALVGAGLPDGLLALALAGSWLLIPVGASFLLDGEDPTPLAIAQVALFPLVAGLATQRWTLAILAVLLGLTLLALWSRVRALVPATTLTEEERERVPSHPIIAGGSPEARVEDVVLAAPDLPSLPGRAADASLIFALGLVAMAALLTMGTEIFYIKDGFGGRMNTVFKLYYQGWIMMAVASAFTLHYLARRLPIAARVAWLALVAILVGASLWYPVEAIGARADFDRPANWDGRFWMQNNDPDRFAAIEWLNQIPGQVVVLEKIGGQYDAGASALAGWTGHSTLVGWGGHELQWRGTYDEVGLREPVIASIYQTTDVDLARTLIDTWNIDFVALTPAEISHYELSGRQIDKFYEMMTPAFQQGNVTIFGR